MRVALITSFLANVMVTLVSLLILPERVAIHFGLGGLPDSWASNLNSTLLMLGIHALVFVSLYFSPKLLATMPSRWISLPNRNYWLAPERRSEAVAKFSQFMWQFGTAIFLFMLLAGVLTMRANLSEPVRLEEGVLLIGLAIFLAYTAYWTLALLRAFRVNTESA
jgi:uncharacterized membrane protein